MADSTQDDAVEYGEPVQISNEFATIRVRKVHTRNGERLEIHSPRLGYSIRLDPLELESLTWQTSETFSKLLETPYGPEGS
ncbi:dihydrodiol dehydrogenase [Nocardia sp. NPDC050408]|uniref:dihydrodiol dehydrogenase n=1 Tax=Nocardia sp. NPDC050408 TaxID=3364319 RepID=UPI0037B7C090